MEDTCTYQIEVRGWIDEKDLNTISPLQVTMMLADADEEHPDADREYPEAATRFTVCTDQSGLIGLLRHLHGRGVLLLSVRREPEPVD